MSSDTEEIERAFGQGQERTLIIKPKETYSQDPDVGVATNQGTRESNDDFSIVETTRQPLGNSSEVVGLYILADGSGNNGGRASKQVAETIQVAKPKHPSELQSLVEKISGELLGENEQRGFHERLTTTLDVNALIEAQDASGVTIYDLYTCSIGDAPTFVTEGGGSKKITTDDGFDPIVRQLGNSDGTEVQEGNNLTTRLKLGSIVVIGSDGLTKGLDTSKHGDLEEEQAQAMALRDLVNDFRNLSAQEIAGNIVSRCVEFIKQHRFIVALIM